MFHTKDTNTLGGEFSAEARGNVSMTSNTMGEDTDRKRLVGGKEFRSYFSILNCINLSILEIVEHLFRPPTIDEHTVDGRLAIRSPVRLLWLISSKLPPNFLRNGVES